MAAANSGANAAHPTQVQVLAARVRMKADKRLKRESSPQIKKIAGAEQPPTAPRS